MSDERVKRRVADVKRDAMAHYANMGYAILPSNNDIICFSAVDKAGTHERKVRVTVDEITKRDVDLLLSLRIPPNQTKEIICRPYGSRGWKKRIYDHLNVLCQ